MVHSPDFFPENSRIFFRWELGFFWMALVEQLGGDGRWYVQLSAMWHWYLPLCIFIKKNFYFILFLSIHFSNFSLIWSAQYINTYNSTQSYNVLFNVSHGAVSTPFWWLLKKTKKNSFIQNHMWVLIESWEQHIKVNNNNNIISIQHRWMVDITAKDWLKILVWFGPPSVVVAGVQLCRTTPMLGFLRVFSALAP